MTFLFPLGLAALLTLPIIIILHLLRERRRRVLTPSLLLWRNLPPSPAAERVRRLPLTLLLLLHLLAAALLGLALGRPQWAGLPARARQLAIVIDTSTSMAARAGATARFDLARAEARALLDGLGAGDRAALIAAGPSAQLIARGTGAEQAALLAALDRLEPGGVAADLAGALALAQASFEGSPGREVVVLSDGGPTDPTPLPTSLAAQIDWRQLGTPQANRAIVALAARPWGANVQVYARVANYDTAPFNASVRLYADERLLGARAVALAPDGASELTWTLPARYASLRVALDGADGLALDDQAGLNLAATRPTAVLLVSDAPEALRRALAAVPGVRLAIVSPAEYQAQQAAHAPALTIFERFLPPAWPAGASLAIAPPPNHPLLAAEGAAPPAPAAAPGALLAGLSLGSIDFGRTPPLALPAWASVLLEREGVPLLARGTLAGHAIAIWNFDPSAGNLATRLAFPLLVARTVRDLTPPPLPQSIQAGTAPALRPDSRASELRITAPGGEQQRLPSAAAVALGPLRQPGFYQIEEHAPAGLLFHGALAVNAGAPGEANLRQQPAPVIAARPPAADDERQPARRELWPWLALAALAVLAAEWLYLHRPLPAEARTA